MSNTNPQRKMSRLQLKKLRAAAEDNDKIRVDYKRATITITKIERELKDAWERNEVQNKYWHNIGVERNSLKESQPKLLKHIISIEKVNAELKEKVSELETELYFCNRNNRIGEVVDERTKVETR